MKKVAECKKVVKNIKEFITLILDDILLVAGVAFISKGAFTINEAAGFIVMGLCLLGLAFIVAKWR